MLGSVASLAKRADDLREVTAERQIFFGNVDQSRGGCDFDRRPAAPNGGGRLRSPWNPAFEHGEDDRDVQAIDQELRIQQKLRDVRRVVSHCAERKHG